MKISVIIVSYKIKTHLEQCLYSVLAALEGFDSEIIVVDNDSQDGMVDEFAVRFPGIKILGLKENIGFARANNLGVKEAQGDYVLILNPDTLMGESFFRELLPFADSTENFGAIGVRMVNANGQFHPESKRNIPNPTNAFGKLFNRLGGERVKSNYYKTDVAEDQIAEVEILSGACMLLKKKIYQDIGGFDEQYFMYGEDIDLSYSLIQKGYKNFYKGDTLLLHYKGESTIKDETYLDRFFGAMKIFLKKYYKSKSFFSYYVMLCGINLRHTIAKKRLPKEESKKYQNPCQPSDLVVHTSIENGNCILLKGAEMSNDDILQYLVTNVQTQKQIFIQPKGMNVYIGDGVVYSI